MRALKAPVLHLVAGPDGSGKSTLVAWALQPATQLRFVNADVIAAERWPDDEMVHAYEASVIAAEERQSLLVEKTSFITETVFSHPSKLYLLDEAVARGYLVHFHVVMVPLELTVQRVKERVREGGHAVPEEKIRGRYQRLWDLVAEGIEMADFATVYDNSRAATPFRMVATCQNGILIDRPVWPRWAPPSLME